MPLSTSHARHDLPLATPFEISRGPATEHTTVHTVEVADGDGRTGYGAAAPSAYYGESPEGVENVLPELLSVVREIGDPFAQQRLAARLQEAAPAQAAARAAVSVAVHDLAARKTAEPLYRRFGLDPGAAPKTSLSIGIAAPDAMAARAQEAVADGFDVLKVKLGTDDDRARLAAVREAAPDARIRVDANGAWSPEEALAATEWLAEAEVEFLEQPVAAADVAGLARVHEDGAVPVAADEACVTAADVPAVGDACAIVVVKLMKCGGVRPALRQIAAAQAQDCAVMLGCMVESAASIAAGCHLAPVVEYADLDGGLLLAADPYDGVPLPAGRIDLGAVADRPGTGVGPG